MMLNIHKIKKTFVLQHDRSDCGVACLISLINFYGGKSSFEQVRIMSGTSTQGTTLLGLYKAANVLGFKAEGCEADVKSLISHNQPVILHVLINNKFNHYIICYGFEENKFIIGDPGKGILYYDQDELMEIWISKKCLILEKSKEFENLVRNKKTKLDFFKNILSKDYPLIIVSFILGICISILGLVMIIFSQRLIDKILPDKSINQLVVGIILVTFLLFVRTALQALRQFILIKQNNFFNVRIIKLFFDHILKLPKSFFDTRKIGELVARLNDTQRIQKVINQIIDSIVVDGIISIFSIIGLFYYSWEVGLIALFSLPIYYFIVSKFNSKLILHQKEIMQGYAATEGNYINTLQGISEIKIFNKQLQYSNLNQFIYRKFQNKIFDLGKTNIRLSVLIGILSVVFLSTILSYSSYQVFLNLITIGEFMAILGLASSILPSINNLIQISIPFNEAKVAFERMYEFIEISHEQEEGSLIEKIDYIELKDISFSFNGRSHFLNNINISAKKGETIALIGESGSGKTTIGHILQKFHEIEHGKIEINTKYDLFKVKTTSWRSLISIVPQNIHIFNGTVLDNICLGWENEKQIEEAMLFCQEYGFSEFIEQLPQGAATIIGEEGINISGGQRQIIAFARALYTKPDLLILDEATSSLDKNTDLFIQSLILKLKSKMIIIYISHKLENLKTICDRIYILEKGRISNYGNHDELLKTENFYSDFWKYLENV